MGIGDDLQYKIGGVVPVWAGAIGLSGAYILYSRKKSSAAAAQAAAAQAQQAQANTVANQTLSSTSSADEIDPSTGMTFAQEQSIDPATGQTYLSEWESANQMLTSPFNGSVPLSNTGSLPSTSAGSTVTYQTNGQWEEAAINYLIANGYDPSTVTSAISAFISGGTVTSQMQSLIGLAEGKLGAPPEGITATTTQTPNASQAGYGYGGDSTFQYNGHTYQQIPDIQTATNLIKQGVQIMYQPQPGVAAPWNTSENGFYNGSATALYYAVS